MTASIDSDIFEKGQIYYSLLSKFIIGKSQSMMNNQLTQTMTNQSILIFN